MHPLKGANSSILCIEDNEKHLLLRRFVLEKNGYSVLNAATALEALALLRKFPVSLVISDHLLSGITGTELAVDLKKIQPHVPILLYSGAAPETLGSVDCFMSKTEPVETFLAMVRDLVHRYLQDVA